MKIIILLGFLCFSAQAQDYTHLKVFNGVGTNTWLVFTSSTSVKYKLEVLPGVNDFWYDVALVSDMEFADSSVVLWSRAVDGIPLPDAVWNVDLYWGEDGNFYYSVASIGGNYVGYFVQGLCYGMLFAGLAAVIWLVRRGVQVSTGSSVGD